MKKRKDLRILDAFSAGAEFELEALDGSPVKACCFNAQEEKIEDFDPLRTEFVTSQPDIMAAADVCIFIIHTSNSAYMIGWDWVKNFHNYTRCKDTERYGHQTFVPASKLRSMESMAANHK
jgi:hypothetical protein